MSIRVYFSQHTCQTTHEEETPVCVRIQRSRATVQDLHRRLPDAYQRDAVCKPRPCAHHYSAGR
jgi:hypothetical protein